MSERSRKVLGENIRKLRSSLSITQEILADRSGLHRTYIGAVERGERNVSLDNIVAISKALGVSASELMLEVSEC